MFVIASTSLAQFCAPKLNNYIGLVEAGYSVNFYCLNIPMSDAVNRN